MTKKKSKLILKNPMDFTLLITVFILLGLGIITVLSASSPTALAESGNSYKYVEKQGLAAFVGVVIMLGLSKVDYKLWQKNYKVIFTLCIVLLLGVCVLGASSRGATRWLDLGFISFQPSEIAKVGIIIFYSAWLTKNKEKLKSIKEGFFIPWAMLLPVIIIVLGFQTHFSATLVMCLLVAILMILAGCRIRYFIMIGVPVGTLAVIALLALGQGFRLQRVITF